MFKLKLIIYFVSLFALFNCSKVDIERINKTQTQATQNQSEWITATSIIQDIGNNQNSLVYGHCYVMGAETPDISSLKTEKQNIVKGEFTDTLLNLYAYQNYNYCSYISTSNDVIYGEIKSFTPVPHAMSVHIKELDLFTYDSCNVEVELTGKGSFYVKNVGVCIESSGLPDINSIHTLKTYNASISSIKLGNLQENTSYIVRPVIQLHENHYIYGDTVSFIIPVLQVTTDEVTVTGSTTADLKGTINSIGVYPVSDYGFCWSVTTSMPTVNNEKISIGETNTALSFTHNFTGIQTASTYYFRAYAIANNKVVYGEVLNF